MQKIIKYLKNLSKFVCLFLSLIPFSRVIAVNDIAEATGTLLSGTSLLTKFFWAACIFTGVYLVTSGFVNYKEHRNNPKLIPLSTVIVYFILGLAVIGIPFLSRLFGSDSYDFATKGTQYN